MTTHFDFIGKFENELKLDKLQPKVTASILEEQKYADNTSAEYATFMENKKNLNDIYQQCRQDHENYKIDIERLDVETISKYCSDISYQVKKLCRDVSTNLELVEKDRTHKSGIIAKMESLREKLLFRESELRTNLQRDFMKNASRQRRMRGNGAPKLDRKAQNNIIFGLAKADAVKTMGVMFTIDHEELGDIFGVSHETGPVKPAESFASWPHVTNTRADNIIPLSSGIKQPTRFDHTTKTVSNYLFTLSGFFKDRAFINDLNEKYYHPLGLEMSMTQDKKMKFKWYIRLTVISVDDTINFPLKHKSVIDETVEFARAF